MKVLYVDEKCVDCTSDPHPVNYNSLNDMLNDVLKVVENDDLVCGINRVVLEGILTGTYESDYYGTTPYDENDKPAIGPYAKKHKVEGLYFWRDSTIPKSRHLPPGLTGVKEAIRMIKKNQDRFEELAIGVTWTAFMDHNCSDFIVVKVHKGIVDYSNQDWYVGSEKYLEHIRKLADFLGVDIRPSEAY